MYFEKTIIFIMALTNYRNRQCLKLTPNYTRKTVSWGKFTSLISYSLIDYNESHYNVHTMTCTYKYLTININCFPN